MAIIAGNWKMNKTVSESISLVKELKKLVKLSNESEKGLEKSKTFQKDAKNEVIICPPFTALSDVSEELKGSNIKLGAQNMHFEEQGAFTAEISPIMLKELVKYVILGHSERRHIFNESDELINKKLKSALKHNLKPILCVGETLEEREKNKTKEVIKKQLTQSLKNIKEKVIVAYEPVWAIGTGKTATPEQAEEVHSYIKELLGDVIILYGGSVKPQNIKELIAQPNIDGALVGGASLDAKSFAQIVKC